MIGRSMVFELAEIVRSIDGAVGEVFTEATPKGFYLPGSYVPSLDFDVVSAGRARLNPDPVALTGDPSNANVIRSY